MRNQPSQSFRKFAGAACLALAASTAVGQNTPRGPDVDPIAAGCNIGPFQQVTKAGPYNAICKKISDAEKCLALIKGQFQTDGKHRRFYKSSHDQARAGYCLATLQKDLGIGE